MSVFTVQTNSIAQGQMDLQYNASNPTGVQMATSLQRTIFINGPKLNQRELHDGDTFTASNYYKRFCPYDPVSNPVGCTLENAFLVCTTDDGSIWDDTTKGSGAAPKVYTFSETTNMDYAHNYVDILGTTGGYATFCVIQNLNTSPGDALQVRLNGNLNAVFTVAAGSDQVFDKGDLLIGKIELCNALASGGTHLTAQVIVGVEGLGL